MSTIDAEDLETNGYFLPEDSQLRLKQLREYVEFLANLARPRIADEAEEGAAEIHPGEVAICLRLLGEQIGQVLAEVSWPAERGERPAAREADADAEADTDTKVATQGATGPMINEAGKRLLFGVTLDQFDEINLLLESCELLATW